MELREKEIQLFTEALEKARVEFYLDAITLLKKLIEEFPDSELVDDALYDIGLCYFNMNQFEKAIEYFQKVIDEYPDATISVLTGGNEYGKTAAKCHYALMNCYLGMNNLDLAWSMIKELDNYPDSYIYIDNGLKKTFKEIALNAIKVYKDKIR